MGNKVLQVYLVVSQIQVILGILVTQDTQDIQVLLEL